jgi:carbon-monoxide dehydrogenase large subunit
MGARVNRKEDPRLITGKGTYVGDLKLPGMHYVAFVRSPYAHARIDEIDASAALSRQGVVAVITGQELASRYEPMPFPFEAGDADEEANSKRTHYALSVERVRHVGEAVAAVIATDPAIAADAVEEVMVDWEPLPAISGIEQALEASAPVLFDDMSGNVQEIWRRKSGDVEAAFANAHRVIKQRLTSQRLAGVPMEGRSIVAAPDPTTGGLMVWTSTQAPHQTRNQLAAVLRMPENAIRVIAPEVGGGFGVKIGIYPEDVVLAKLASQYQLPLQWVESRSEHMLTTTHGRGQIADYAVAVQADGRISGLQLTVVADMGAYPLLLVIPQLTGFMAVGVYHIPAVDIEIDCVFTNATPIAAYRGAGRPEAAYYIERLIELIANELGMDPAAVRRKNFIPPEVFPYEAATGEVTYDSGEYEKALDKALQIANYAGLRAEQKQRRVQNSGRLLGIGLACYVEMCGFGPYESAELRVEPSGSVTVFTGISPHGQGQETTFAQIVADQLGADYDQIIVKHGDTATTPMGVGTFGSRGLAVGGAALVRAADKVRHKAKRIASHILEAAPEDIELVEGRYQVRGVPAQALTLAQIANRAYSDDLPETIDSGLEESDFFRPELVYPFGAHVAVVEVEPETGLVSIREYYSVDDCGPRISPNLVEGQVHGGLAQGIAQALLEEVTYSQDGQLLSGSLMDYGVPRADQFPQFVTDYTETHTPHNPLGAKGIGEAATIGSTPAIVNAVMDALKPLGVHHLDMPLKPEKICWAIQRNGAAGD